MATFREYIASLGAAGAVPEAELDELLGRYEWFALARLVRLRQRGGDPSEDGRLGFAVQDRAAGTAPEVDRERLTALCADDLIDDFLRAGDYRIVAEEGEADDEVKTCPQRWPKARLMPPQLLCRALAVPRRWWRRQRRRPRWRLPQRQGLRRWHRWCLGLRDFWMLY